MKKQKTIFTQGRLAIAVAIGLSGISVMGTANSQVPRAATGANSSGASVNVGSNPTVNPYGGAIPPAPSVGVNAGANNQINYTGNPNGLEQQNSIAIPNNINQAQLNPALAAQNAGILPPAGLPPVSGVSRVQRGSNIDPVDLQLEILNSPDEKIRDLRKDMYDKARVINEGNTSAPLPTKNAIVAEITPGATSPVVRVSKNRTSTIIITDMTGQPWPIINMDGLTQEDFVVKRLDNPAPDGYVLSVTPRGSFVSGNLVLVLKGLPSPINIEFVPAQREVDVNTEIRVQARGPNTQYATMGMPSSMDSSLLYILQGVGPTGSKELKTSSNAVQAWLARDGSMFVRTRYKVMAPAFESVTSSPDGTFAYKMIPVPVVLFKTDDGRFGEFSIDGI